MVDDHVTADLSEMWLPGRPRWIARYEKTYSAPNEIDFIDGLCDTTYVICGSAVAAGIDLDPYFEEVHRANMNKLAGGKRLDGKQLKPEGWRPPDHEKILIRQRNLADEWKRLEESWQRRDSK